MQFGRQVTSSTSLQIPPQPGGAAFRNRHPILVDTIQPVLVRAIINPKRRMEEPLQLPTPQPPRSCSSPGKSCWNLDVRVAVLLVTLAGAVILLLLYRLLQLRHRLRLARARHALEYYSFYHSATYTLKQPTPCQEVPAKNGSVPDAAPPIQTVTTVTPAIITTAPPPPPPAAPPPAKPLPPPPVLPTPPVPPPPPVHPPASAVLSLPLPLPVIHTTPPSPHLSWGACSDADVYSRIGAFRPSRLSSLSSQSTVILFEHSSL